MNKIYYINTFKYTVRLKNKQYKSSKAKYYKQDTDELDAEIKTIKHIIHVMKIYNKSI
jgi:hypothetical protein